MTQGNSADLAHYDGGGSSRPSSAFWYYFGILLRRIWIILPIVVIAFTLGLIKAFRAPKYYRAMAKVLVERNAPDLMKFDNMDDRFGWDPDFYSTQAQLIRSRAVMDVALRQPGMKELFETGGETNATVHSEHRTSLWGEIRGTMIALLGAEPLAPPEPWQSLRDQIGAVHVPDTHFIEIRVVHGNASVAAMTANAAAVAFQDYHRQKKLETLGEAFQLLQKEKDKEEVELLKAEKELQEFREKAQGVSVDSARSDQPAVERLTKLNEELTQVQLKRIELTAEIAVMKDVLSGQNELARKSEDRLFSIPTIQTDQTLSDARKKLGDSEKELTTLTGTYGSEHPLIVAARAKVALQRDQFRMAVNETMASHINKLKVLEGQEAVLQSTYDEQKKVALDLAKEEFSFTRLQSNVDRHRRLFEALAAKMREVDVSSGLVKTNVQVVERAAVPTLPIGAGKMRTVVLALLVGLFLGGGLAFVAENLDDTVKTPEDLRDRLDLPLLGFVPEIETAEAEAVAGPGVAVADAEVDRFRDIKPTFRERLHTTLCEFLPFMEKPQKGRSEAGRSRRGRIVLTEPMSSVAEAYRSIRASLFYSTPANEIKLLAVTSCRPQEGKTTTSVNLSISIAQTGKRVLLIDGDLHRPSVHRTLGIRPTMGLTSVLVGEASLGDAIVHVEHEGKALENLDVLAAGPSSPNPSELLNSNRMKELLASVKRTYDWVIVDTPPVLFVSDARIISVMCDGVLIIVKSGTSTRSLLTRAREQLDMVKARVIGSVLNDVRVSRVGRHYSSYYSYGYSRYAKDYKSDYHSEQAGEAADASAAGTAAGGGAAGAAGPAPKAVDQEEDRSHRLTPIEQARMHLAAGNPGRARTILEEQIDAKPDGLDAWEMLMAIAVELKDEPALRRHLGRFRELRGAQGYLWAYGNGSLAMMQNHPGKARDFLDQALTMKPTNPRILEGMLRLDLQEGQVALAKTRSARLLEHDPENAYAHYVAGTLLLVSEDLTGAEIELRKSLSIRPSAEALNDLAWLLHRQGKLVEAEDLARSALEIDSRNHPIWDTLGFILLDAGRLDEAESSLERAHALSGGDAVTALGLSEVFRRRDLRSKAAEFAAQAAAKRYQLSKSEKAMLSEIERWLGQG